MALSAVITRRAVARAPAAVHVGVSMGARATVGAAELARMKPSATLVNTSRGPIVDQAARIDALTTRSISGAALDVFDVEPLPVRHPLRRLAHVIVTPHIGFVTDTQYRPFYGEAAASIDAWARRCCWLINRCGVHMPRRTYSLIACSLS